MADESSTQAETSVIHCKLCLTDCPAPETCTLQSCNCVFCVQCLKQYVSLAIQGGAGSPITCPDPTCRNTGTLLVSEIASLVTNDQLELYQRLLFERGVQLDPTKTWCPALDCQAVCNVPARAKGKAAPIPCHTCYTVFCFSCRGRWDNGHSCSQEQPLITPSADGGLASTDPDAAIKPCPMCGVYIERNQGCAQMLCKSCKHTFCWYCLQNLDGDIFLRHYDKGPCRNKLGHSRASVMWNRTQVVGILVGVSIIVLVTSPLLLLASPCILCCVCKPCQAKKSNKKRKREDKKPSDSTA